MFLLSNQVNLSDVLNWEKCFNSVKGLFLNADPGFDSIEFNIACQKEEIIANVKPNPRNSTGQNAATENKQAYQSGTHIFDDERYRDRAVIEHANAWMDGFKALSIRFECCVNN